MLDKLIVFTSVAVLALAIDLQVPQTYASTPSPYTASTPSPSIATYSSRPGGPGAPGIEAYKTVTAHPPPAAYKKSPTAAPYVPTYINPSFPSTGVDGAGAPALSSYPSPGYPNYPVAPYFTPNSALPQPTAGSPTANRQLIKLVDTSEYGPYDPESKPTTAQFPALVQQSAGNNHGAHLVYAPVENSVAYTKPAIRPVATYAVQSAYANYAKSAAAYSPQKYSPLYTNPAIPAQDVQAQYYPAQDVQAQYSAAQNVQGQYYPAQNVQAQYSPAQNVQAQYTSPQYTPVQYSPEQYPSPTQFTAPQYPTAQFPAAQYSPVAYSPANAVSQVRFNGIGANYAY